jgi:cob(I)alamin adenosyltransferase
MKIYTNTGDDGTTGLFAGGRVSKVHPRICAYGTVDELNAVLGAAVTQLSTDENRPADVLPSMNTAGSDADSLTARLLRIQSDLFCLGAELATPNPDEHGMRMLPTSSLEAIESTIDELDAVLPELKTFILPGGTQLAAGLHIARTVCRRAEREVVALSAETECDCEQVLIYLNRLSDLLFVLARWANHAVGIPDTAWEGT